jgi:hypothetical protein
MKKIILSFLLFTFSCIAFAKNELNTNIKKAVILESKNSISKQHQIYSSLQNDKKKIKFIAVNYKKTLNCSIHGVAWADTFELDCPDGSSSTYVVSGIAWEITCIDSQIGYFSFAYCTDVQSELISGC